MIAAAIVSFRIMAPTLHSVSPSPNGPQRLTLGGGGFQPGNLVAQRGDYACFAVMHATAPLEPIGR